MPTIKKKCIVAVPWKKMVMKMHHNAMNVDYLVQLHIQEFY
jgi:hypothetical protein